MVGPTSPTTGLAEQIRQLAIRLATEVKAKSPLTAVQTGPPASPVTGQLWWDTDEPQVQAVGDITMTQEYAGGSSPNAPATGLKLFSRFKARRVPSVVDSFGTESRLQSALYGRNVVWLQAVNNGAITGPTVIGVAVNWQHNATTTPSSQAIANTNFYSMTVRVRTSTTATTNTGAGVRPTSAQWMLSTTPGMGGFHFVARVGLAAGALGTRGFIGMSSQTAAYLNTVNPSGQAQQVGFYWDATHTTLHFIASGSSLGVGVDLGASFPVTSSFSTYLYELSIYVPSGQGQYGLWSATRLNDGVTVSGTFGTPGSGTSTTLPTNNMLMSFQLNYTNAALAQVVSMDIQSVYLETDN